MVIGGSEIPIYTLYNYMPNSFTNTAAHEICSFGNKSTTSFTTERDHKKTKQEDSKTLLCVH